MNSTTIKEIFKQNKLTNLTIRINKNIMQRPKVTIT